MSRQPDDFGDRMKVYEGASESRLDPLLPIYARIDGRGFSRFTRGMARPFDPAMSAAMVEATKRLVADTHARIGYTQSDEISLVWLGGTAVSDVIFSGRLQKLVSVLAGLATAAFTRALLDDPSMTKYVERLPHFDCRVCQLPSKIEAANMFLWRERDAVKNAVSMAAQHHFSHKSLQQKSVRQMREMLAEAGIDFEAYPSFFKRGTFLRRVTFDRTFTADELARIPVTHRPDPASLVTRSEIRALDMPDFNTVSNRVEVIFDAALPSLQQEGDSRS